MEGVSTTQQCTNCQQYFPADRIDLHEAYCRRNIRKCQQCAVFVDTNELASHQEKFHRRQACVHCEVELSPVKLKAHQPQCPRKPRVCVYCQTEFPYAEIGAHESICEARSRLCNVCNQNVNIKDFAFHESRCREPMLPNVPRPILPVNLNPPNLPLPNRNPERRRSRQRERERQREVERQRQRHSRDNDNRHHGGEHSLSTNKHGPRQPPTRAGKQVKYTKQIPLEAPQPFINIIPISVQLTISRNKNRQPFKVANSES